MNTTIRHTYFPKLLLMLLLLLLLQITLTAQVQWYQDQDGNNPPPYGTSAVSAQSFTAKSFVACYQWTTQGDDQTWKIDKSHIDGTEQKSFFITGPSAQVEFKVGPRNTIYVLERCYPLGQNAVYIVYKLDSNLAVKSQRPIEFPNNFNLFNLNAFELDEDGNVYFAGDGQYPDGPGFRPASFVLKTNKDLETKWSYMDSSQTSFTRLHIDRWGRVIVIGDFYSFFPDVHILRISADGKSKQTMTVSTDPGRYSLSSVLDDDDNLILYGGKFVGDADQAFYLLKLSHTNGRILYNKTHFTAAGSQLNDLKIDRHGAIYSLVTLYFASGGQAAVVSRINSMSGKLDWSRSFPYAKDSVNYFKLVMNRGEKFYAIGEKRRRDIYSSGYATRFRTNGLLDGGYTGPDSTTAQLSHCLMDGLLDRDDQLIAVGNTNDIDTLTRQSNYYRAFALRFGTRKNSHNNDCNVFRREEATPEAMVVKADPAIFPNPVQDQLLVVNLDGFDRLAVYNLNGDKLIQQKLNSPVARIATTALSNGVYVLTIHATGNAPTKTIKFVVSR